jgi:hypothetical protein
MCWGEKRVLSPFGPADRRTGFAAELSRFGGEGR